MRAFFTSSESFGEGKGSADFYMEMDRVFNEGLADKFYGDGIDCCSLMFVFHREDGPGDRGKERTLYKRQSRELDLRLFADHDGWRRARTEKNPPEQYRLLYDVAARSFDIMRAKKIPNLDVDALERDVHALAAAQGWTR